MSAEPCRKRAYHSDLRWRIVWKKLAMGLTYQQIAVRLNIAASTARSVYSLFELTGDVQPKLVNGPRRDQRKLNEQMELFVLGLILENPCLYLSEIGKMVEDASGIRVSEATVCRTLKQHGFTRKRVRQVAAQRSDSLRGSFMAQVLLYRPELFVWMDETGCDRRNCMRKFGYAIRGDTPTYHRILVRGQRISAIAAISSDGLVAVDLKNGSVDSEFMYDFIRGTLIPQMHSFDGSNPKSIIIMDNCSIHHVEEIKQLLDAVGIVVFFLPPCPNFNPIEECFSYIKYYLKQHDELIQTFSNPETIVTAAFNSITSRAWIYHSGYQ